MDLSKIMNHEALARTGSGICVVLGILGGVYMGGPVWFLMSSAIALVSLEEFYRMILENLHVSRGIGYIAAVIILIATYFSESTAILPVITLCGFLVLFVEIIRRSLSGSSFGVQNISGTLAGVFYCVLPWCFLVFLRDHAWGVFLLVTLFACTWSCDVLAYVVGSCWGKTPLAPEVSSKKSIEGFVGGLAGSLLCAGALSYLWGIRPVPLLLIGLFCGTFGQLGDLAESLLKRETGKKDSGSIIPGHGGMLDRFDSILVNASLVYLFFGVLWQ
jgi:phosphatidate cytidylyltransferase